MAQQQTYSEADMGDMSHYDPNLGVKYPRMGHPKTNNQRKQTHKKKFGTNKLPPRGTGLNPKIIQKHPSKTRTIKPSVRKQSDKSNAEKILGSHDRIQRSLRKTMGYE
jgi:hypothetical protein